MEERGKKTSLPYRFAAGKRGWIKWETGKMEVAMENEYIKLVPADLSLGGQLVDYYRRNREFLKEFEPERDEAFFLLEQDRKSVV